MLFDEVLEQIGEGIFQKFVLVVCGLSVLAEAIATTAVPFSMILVSCDLQLTVFQIFGLNATLIVSKLISGYWLGAVSDMSGRKLVLSTTSIITFLGCFMASFSQCVIMLFISLFLLGVGLGGNHSATRIFIIEITPQFVRGSRFVFLELFGAVGYASAIGLTRLLVPGSAGNVLGNNVRLNSWRILFGLSGSLSIFSSCLMSVLPASPRWLLGKKHEEDAIDILRKLFAVNKVKHEESFPRHFRLDSIMQVDRSEFHNLQCNNPFFRSIQCVQTFTLHLFNKKFLSTTFTCILISTFLFDGSVFRKLPKEVLRTYLNLNTNLLLVMMNIWLSLTLFFRNMNQCYLNGASPIVVDFSEQTCKQELLEDLFTINAYLSVCSLILIIVLCFADRIPRKYTLMFSSFSSGLAMIGLVFISHYIIKIVLAFIVLSFMYIAEVMFRIIVLESYPTVLRATAYGFLTIFSKITLICLMIFLRVPCEWAFISFGAAFALVGIFCALLPNLNKLPMRD